MMDTKEKAARERLPGASTADEVVRPFIIAAMSVAVITGLVIIADIIAPRRTWDFLPWIAFVIGLEAVFTTRWLRRPEQRQLNHARYRLAELLVIAIVLRFLTWLLSGGLPDAATLRSYLLSPLSFFDGTYFVFLLVSLIAWERSASFSTMFLGLTPSSSELDYYSLPRQEQRKRYHDRPIDRSRPQVFSTLVKNWLATGFFLALLAGLTTVDLPSVPQTGTIRNVARLGIQPEMLVALLVYFLLGLWLLSQGRLAMMQTRWLADNVASGDDLARTWRRNSVFLILAAAVVAAFLPIGRTLGAAPLAQLLFEVMTAVWQFFFVMIVAFFLFLVRLLGLQSPVEENEQLLTEPGSAPPAPFGSLGGETAALVAGSLFWVLVVIVGALALLFFLRDRGYAPGLDQLRLFWSRFLDWLRSLSHAASERVSAAARNVRARLDAASAAGRQEGSSRWRFLRVNALPPRERIRYFYLSTVRRAGERGVLRQQSDTPLEYARDLKENWPEADGEIEQLTTAFVEARYSRQEFAEEDVSPVQQVWKRVRSALRRRRSGNGDEEE